jgi:tetratricopeptide (TPR) repeat protein
MADAFISYAEEDSRTAAGIARLLAEGGLSSWRYEADSVGGQNYLLQTRAQIEACGLFLVLLTPASLASEQIDREVVRAHECGKPCLPVLEGVTYDEFTRARPAWQQAMGAVTALAVPDGGVDALGERLVAGARAALGRQASPRREGTPPRPPWPVRLGRALRTRRAAVAAALLALAALGAHLWREREAAADRQAAVEARVEAARLLDAGRFDDADPLLARAIALAPDDDEAHLLLGRLRVGQREPERALPHLERRLRARPRDAAALYWRGLAHSALGKADAAVADLSAAIDGTGLAEDEWVDARYERGLALLDRNHPAHPVRVELTQAQRREVEDAAGDFGAVYERRGWVYALIERGRARSWLGLDDEARRDLGEAYRRASGTGRSEDAWMAAESAYLLGLLDLRAAWRSGQATSVSRATESFDVALRHDPGVLKFRVGRALARAATGYLPEGITEIEEALQGLAASDPLHASVRALADELRASAARLPVQDLVVEAGRVDGPEGAGTEFRARCTIHGRRGVPCHLVLRVFEASQSPYLHDWQPLRPRDARYAGPDGTLAVVARVVPTEDPHEVRDLRVFMPYAQTPVYDGPQRYEFTLAFRDAEGTISRLVDGHFSFTATPR